MGRVLATLIIYGFAYVVLEVAMRVGRRKPS
jgi:hypothetical protein